jgi:hypothetical protein
MEEKLKAIADQLKALVDETGIEVAMSASPNYESKFITMFDGGNTWNFPESYNISHHPIDTRIKEGEA